MSINHRVRRIAGRTSLGLVMLGAGAAALAATHPAAAAGALGAVFNVVTTCSTTTACITGKNTKSGTGVLGSSAKGTGVQGTGGTGVSGSSPSGYGVYGTTKSGNGIGVIGYATGSGTGTYGFSQSNYALEGVTSDGYGLYADAYGSGSGVYISADTGYGLIDYTSGSVPIYARNSAGNGADIEGTYIGIIGRAPASGGFPLVLTDENGNNLFYVDGAGNVSYAGGLFNFARVKGGATVKSFSAKMTLPTVEDTGTAQLVGGVASVRLDPTFAASIDQGTSYRVFVTPNGDTRGLFVPTKTANGFIVRESQGGRSSVSFDYRIVATAFGQSGQRMAVTGSTGLPHAKPPIAPHVRNGKLVTKAATP
jgi:hypothetical protein